MPNAKDYQKGTQTKTLAYGPTGGGKSSAFLSHPGKKFVYIFDPAGLETYAGHDVEYEMFVPEIMGLKKSNLGKGSKSAELLRPDPETYLRFEKDFEDRIKDRFFVGYDALGFESLTTFLPMAMWYILEQQGRGNSAPEIQDYYYRTDAISNIVRVAASQANSVFFSAHCEAEKDEVTGRIENMLSLPRSLKTGLPLLFSEVVQFRAEPNRDGNMKYVAQMKPDKRSPLVRTSLSNVQQFEDVTIDWNKPLAGQGFYGLYEKYKVMPEKELREQNSIKMG